MPNNHGRPNQHPPEHSYQFVQQCMEGTDNLALCLCALEAFKQVPVDRARLRHHGRDKKLVLHIHEDSMAEMLPKVNECEAQFGQNDG